MSHRKLWSTEPTNNRFWLTTKALTKTITITITNTTHTHTHMGHHVRFPCREGLRIVKWKRIRWYTNNEYDEGPGCIFVSGLMILIRICTVLCCVTTYSMGFRTETVLNFFFGLGSRAYFGVEIEHPRAREPRKELKSGHFLSQTILIWQSLQRGQSVIYQGGGSTRWQWWLDVAMVMKTCLQGSGRTW